MIVVVLLLSVMLVSGFAAAIYLLGFELGRENWQQELDRTRAEAVDAERRLHELTREAFAAMVTEVERRRRAT